MPSFSETLASQVRSNHRFLQAYSRLQSSSLASLVGQQTSIDEADERKLVRSAIIFAQDGSVPMLLLAQDIAYALAETSKDELVISCLELGMSRIAAQEASDAMQNTNMTPTAVRVWISRVPLQGSLSPLVVREFGRLGLR